jgi:hypothetical protein
MPWRLSVLIFLFSISLSSIATAAIVLPAHNSVTYDLISIDTDEARKGGDRWIVVRVRLYGVKVLGKKFLNGDVKFSYDSHFQGDRADLGLKIIDPASALVSSNSGMVGSISKTVSRGQYKKYRREWGTAMYVGGAKFGRQQAIVQFLYGAKANSEQDYIMLAWMLANSNEIIKYAVENDSKITSKAKQGWRMLGDFTRKAHGSDASNFHTILVAADDRTPPLSTAKVAAKKVRLPISSETQEFRIKTQRALINKLENKNKQLTYQTKTLKEAIASVRKQMKQLSALDNQPQTTTVDKNNQRNNQLTLEVVSLKEQLADLNSKMLSSELEVSQDASKIALNFCVSTKLKHIYAAASNTSCIRPYVQMDQPSMISFSQASGIEQVATLPWVSVKSLTNAQVKTIQYLLVREGFSTSLPDGLLGPKTIKAMQSLLSKIDSGQGNKVVSSQLYLQQDLLDLMLTNAQLTEVKELQRQTIESNNVIDIKDNQINQLTTKINDLLKTSATKGQFDEVAYELKVSKLNDKVAKLQQQIIEKNLIQSKSLLSTDAVASQLTEDLVTAKATITSKDAEIKRLTNELTVAKVKSKNNQINDSSFMETLSEEWRPLIVDMPLTERLFCDLYHDFRIKKDQAEKSNNQIRVNMVHRSFQEDLDSLLPGGSLDQWIVKVLKVSQVAGGDAAIIAELPCDVLVGSGTMNTEEGSEDQLSWVATIPYSSRLYNELAKVSIGDFVNVSGTFVQIKAFESGRNETFYASNSIGKNPLVAELGLDKDLYLLDLGYFMMLR